MSYQTGYFDDPDKPERVCATHLFRDKRAVCGRSFPPRYIFQPITSNNGIDLKLIGCHNCKKWVIKNAKRIATGDLP